MSHRVIKIGKHVLYPPESDVLHQDAGKCSDGKSVYVSGLPEKATKEIIIEVFSTCGEIKGLSVRKCCNVYHITFSDRLHVENARLLSGYTIKIEDEDEKGYLGKLAVYYSKPKHKKVLDYEVPSVDEEKRPCKKTFPCHNNFSFNARPGIWIPEPFRKAEEESNNRLKAEMIEVVNRELAILKEKVEANGEEDMKKWKAFLQRCREDKVINEPDDEKMELDESSYARSMDKNTSVEQLTKESNFSLTNEIRTSQSEIMKDSQQGDMKYRATQMSHQFASVNNTCVKKANVEIFPHSVKRKIESVDSN